jgi:hypothetical protein
MRVSTDNGATFGPVLALSTNGTIVQRNENDDKNECSSIISHNSSNDDW